MRRLRDLSHRFGRFATSSMPRFTTATEKPHYQHGREVDTVSDAQHVE
jgi:hypothetical protein